MSGPVRGKFAFSLVALLGFVTGVVVTRQFAPQRPRLIGPVRDEYALTPAEMELDRVISAIDLDAVPFDRAVADIQKVCRVPIVVDYAALRKAGPFDQHRAVTMHGRKVALAMVLGQLIAQDRSLAELKLGSSGASLVITSSSAAPAEYVRIYDVSDFSAHPDRLPEQPPPYDGPPPPPIKPPREVVNDLTGLITDTVQSDTWRTNGGSVGSIRYLRGRLFICQTLENHRHVRNLLAQLRQPPEEVKPERPWPAQSWDEATQSFYLVDPPEPLMQALRKPLPTIHLKGLPLAKALENLSELGHIPIEVDWHELDSFRAIPIALDAANVSLLDAMDRVMANPQLNDEAAYWLREDRIVVTSTKAAAEHQPIRIYDIRDMLGGDPARFELIGDEIQEMIHQAVDPHSWKDNGSPIGYTRIAPPQLIIYQTWANQDKIAHLLARLRAHGFANTRPVAGH